MTSFTIEEQISLKPFNTFGIDVLARYFVFIKKITELQDLLSDAKLKSMPKFVLGGGSNVLFTQDYSGLIIKMALQDIQISRETDEFVWITAGAGTFWHDLVLYCIENNWGGIENLSLIPGTVGAAPIQNIGAYGVELTQVFDHLQAVNIADASLHIFNHADCRFGYRDSIFKNELKNQFIIVSVTLRLAKNPSFNTQYGAITDTLNSMGLQELSLRAISQAVIHIRQSKLPDPATLGNAGSFFKNPIIDRAQFALLQSQFPSMPHYDEGLQQVKIPAGWLIEQCGFKGKRRGNVGVHVAQALVLVNYGGGSGQSIVELATEIQQAVKQQFGITLSVEVNVV